MSESPAIKSIWAVVLLMLLMLLVVAESWGAGAVSNLVGSVAQVLPEILRFFIWIEEISRFLVLIWNSMFRVW